MYGYIMRSGNIDLNQAQAYKERIFNMSFQSVHNYTHFFPQSFYICSKVFVLCLKFTLNCVKRVHIRSFSDTYFPAFGLNTDRYSVSLYIQSKCRKIRTRITPSTNTFHAVIYGYMP